MITRIAVDWDNTLAEEVWPEIGDWKPGAVDALKCLAEIYDEVVIFTLRVATVQQDEVTPHDPTDQYRAIHERLNEAGVPMNVYVWRASYKPPCEFFIDDRNIAFNGDWEQALAQLAIRRVLTNHKERQMEEEPLWIDRDPVCGCNGRCGEPRFEHDGPGDELGILEAARKQEMRRFETGATRNVYDSQLDFEGFVSPLALVAFAEYMHEHRVQADGTLRDSDNWQKGIPTESYLKSLIRHMFDLWLVDRGARQLAREDRRKALCAIIFNAQGYLHELVVGELEETA